MTKKDKSSELYKKKREIRLTNLEKGTLIGAIIVILAGLIAYVHISITARVWFILVNKGKKLR